MIIKFQKYDTYTSIKKYLDDKIETNKIETINLDTNLDFTKFITLLQIIYESHNFKCEFSDDELKIRHKYSNIVDSRKLLFKSIDIILNHEAILYN